MQWIKTLINYDNPDVTKAIVKKMMEQEHLWYMLVNWPTFVWSKCLSRNNVYDSSTMTNN